MATMTQELSVLPCCLITSRHTATLSSRRPSVRTTRSRMSLPPGCTSQNTSSFQSFSTIAFFTSDSMLAATRAATSR
ncbi:hypothetical protein EE612_021854 [Oryza sativa]|nr:hypothetical protein EE612_021854 [Oryza sativa]